VPIDICKMCLQKKELVCSHLMPASLYDYCRKGKHSPIMMGGGIVLPTDRQTQDYLLCSACEGILNRGGETWVADKLATWERTFPLYDLLTSVAPEFDEGGMTVFSAVNNAQIKVDNLIHFALGLFWKASVHSWKGDTTDPRIELGPYSETIRLWLRGEGEFPKYLYLVLVVEKPARAQIAMIDPYEGVREGGRTHFFHAPGVLFMMALGQMVDESVRALAINSAGNPINISEGLTSSFEALMARSLGRSRKTQAYLRAKKKHDEERRRSTS
jgi:hypothetical protein